MYYRKVSVFLKIVVEDIHGIIQLQVDLILLIVIVKITSINQEQANAADAIILV